MLVDTDSDRTIMAARVAKGAHLYPNVKLLILCVHGDVCSYSIAEVKLASGQVDTGSQFTSSCSAELRHVPGGDWIDGSWTNGGDACSS